MSTKTLRYAKMIGTDVMSVCKQILTGVTFGAGVTPRWLGSFLFDYTRRTYEKSLGQTGFETCDRVQPEHS